MPVEFELSIANLSHLSEDENFLLQVSKKSEKLVSFIKAGIPGPDKEWLPDLKSWEIKNKWLKQISDICIEEYEQVFYDMGEELFDLKEAKGLKDFNRKILSKNDNSKME